MAGLILELDAASSNPDGTSPGTALLLTDAASGWQVMAFDPGTAEPEYLFATSVDTEGSVPVSGKHQNRTVTMTVHVAKSTSALLRTALDTLGQKVGKVFAEGGTLKLTLPDATVRIFDLVGGDHGLLFNKRFVNNVLAEVTLRLPARPYMRGAELDLGDNVETTLPCLVFTDTGVTGDVPALGRLVIDNDDATNDQRWLVWGIESNAQYTHTASSGSGALFYEAESRTVLGGSTAVAGPTGASGAGSNVVRNTSLGTSFQAILSTQATGGGAHLSHVGTFRVFARVQVPTANIGTVTVAMEWGEGDFRRFTRNASSTLVTTWEGTWRLVDLGLVSLRKVMTGTQRWEARILAKSTTGGDDIDVDWLMLIPADKGSGTVAAVRRAFTPTSFSVRDEFDQVAGALSGKTLPAGGTWAGAGDADDFSVTGSGTVTRTAVSDAGGAEVGGRLGLAGASTFTNIAGQVGVTIPAANLEVRGGLLLRYVDANNWLQATVGFTGSSLPFLFVHKKVAGASFNVATISLGGSASSLSGTVSIEVRATGEWWASFDGVEVGSGTDTDLATGGALASGRVGIYDSNASVGAMTRTYDNLWFAVPPTADAAAYPSQSLEIRSDRVEREDSTGAMWQPVSSYVGDYLRVPPAGAEARTARVIVKLSRSIPGSGADAGTDDVSARLFVTPRYL